MYELNICIDDIINALCANHKIANKAAVNKAYTYAYEKHKGQVRKTGEPYIMHPLRVARAIASWGFESEVVAAALLHDIVEDCHTPVSEITEKFGSNIAGMVDTLTAVNKDLIKAQGLTKEEIDTMSDARLQKKMSEKALFIKVADRLDNLRTIDGVKEEAKRIAKAKHTREILIPMLMREGAYQLVNELENLCLKIEHPDRYLEINRLYTEMLRCNAFTTRKVLHLFKELFSRNSSLIPNTLLPYLSYIVDFTCSPRSPISIFRQLNREANNINHDLHKLLCKKNVAMYDLTLIVADDSTAADKLTPLDIFYTFYAEALMEKGICILDYKETTHQDARYLVLCDSMDNLYRLFIKTEKEYLHYKLGHIVESDDVISFKDIDTLDPRNTYNKKIKVFKRDGSALYIDAGATMLDFAFAVHSEIGLHFDYALVDGSKTRRPPYERLNEGDKITVVPSEEVKARIQWFKYVRTSKAVEHLVRYLG